MDILIPEKLIASSRVSAAFTYLLVILLSTVISGCSGEGAFSVPSDSTGPVGGTGVVALSWESPMTNTDGSCISDMAGYRVFYGNSSGNYLYQKTVPVETLSCTATGAATSCGSVETCTYSVDSLSQGQWYFAVSSYGSSGTNSALSNEASDAIN